MQTSEESGGDTASAPTAEESHGDTASGPTNDGSVGPNVTGGDAQPQAQSQREPQRSFLRSLSSHFRVHDMVPTADAKEALAAAALSDR